MKCSNCGSNIPANAKFCGVCGAAIQPAEAESSLETVAFDPSSDPEFQAAAEKLQAANQKENKAKENSKAQTSEPKQAEKTPEKAADEPEKAVKKPAPEKTANKTSPEKVVDKSPSQAKQSPAPQPDKGASDADESAAKKKGKFRETIWFMQADDPEMMSSIENEDLDEREATYQDPGGNLDERSREKFSLNISESSMMKAVERDRLHLDDTPESSKSWFYASMIIGAVSLGYVIYLIFAK